MAKLLESEEKYRTLFEASPLGITTLNMKGVITSCNDAAYRAGGYSEDEIIGKHFSKIAPLRIRDIPKHIRTFASVIRGQPIKPFEVPYHCKDGTIGWAEVHIALIKAGGKKKGILVIQNGVTERKQAEETLKAAEARYQDFYENAPDMYVSVDPNTALILKCNQTVATNLGYTKREIVGHPIFDMYHPDCMDDVKRAFQSFVETGEVRNAELQLKRKDGTKIDVSLNVSAVRDDQGNILYSRSAWRDITERKQMEHDIGERLKELQCLYSISKISERTEISLNEVCQEVAHLLPPSWQYPEITCSRITVNKDEFRTENYRDTEWKQCADIKVRGVKTGMVEVGYLEERPAIDEGPFLKEERAVINAVAEHLAEIIQRKQAEERVQELQTELYLSSRLVAIGQLAAGVAHEINNPLTGVIGFSERLLRKSTDEKTKRDLERIHGEGLRIAKVVGNLLTFARHRQPKKKYEDINDILQKALELRAYELKTSNITVKTSLAPALPMTIVDFYQIQEVFLNIVINAEQVMVEAGCGSKLNIKTQQMKGCIRITFTDNGPGISAEHLKKIFNPFFTTRGGKGGTGLGLSVCHSIITEHNGRIYVKSQPGKGATFSIELPLTTKDMGQSQAKRATSGNGQAPPA